MMMRLLVAFVAENDLSGFSPLITAHALKAALASATPPLVLDVRSAKEFERGHLQGALHVPVDELRGRLHELPRDRPLVVACRSGFRGHLALRILVQSGFGAVQNLTGGWVSVEAEGGFAVESGEARAPV